jgi:hypothetical protein
MDTKLKKRIAFHLQTDGQTEVVNRIVVHLLRAYCSKHPKLWDEHLHYVQHAYNRAKHSSTQTSPWGGLKASQWGGVIRGSNFAQFSKCSECDENSALASVSSS